MRMPLSLPIVLPALGQLFFLPMCHLFQRRLAFHRPGFCVELLQIGERYRASDFCVLRARSFIVALYSFFYIVCPPGVETVVAAPHEICIIHFLFYNLM